MMSQHRNGWKGVLKWCKETTPLKVIMDNIQPRRLWYKFRNVRIYIILKLELMNNSMLVHQ